MDDESIVALDELGLGLSALRLCRPTADQQMRRSLAHHGQLTAVVAFDNCAKLELVDGFKRVRASPDRGHLIVVSEDAIGDPDRGLRGRDRGPRVPTAGRRPR